MDIKLIRRKTIRQLDEVEFQNQQRCRVRIVANLVENSSRFSFPMSLLQQQPQVNITTGLDGKGALNMCGKEREWVRFGSDHFDLIGINSSLWSRSSFNIKKKHVLGHQDTLDLSLFWEF